MTIDRKGTLEAHRRQIGASIDNNSSMKAMDVALRAKNREIERKEVAYWVLREAMLAFPGGRIQSVIDVGGGTGAYLALLQQRLDVESLVSTDVDGPEWVDEFGIHHRKVGAEALSAVIPRGSSDLALMVEVIEHIADPDTALSEVRNSLKPRGVLIITTPNLSSLTNRLALLAGFLPPSAEVSTRHVFGRPGSVVAGHMRLHTYRSLQEFLEFYGFSIMRAYAVVGSSDVYQSGGRLGRLAGLLDAIGAGISGRLGSRLVFVARKDDG